MKISVIIPVYNGEHTIARAIDSVLAQTRPADEMIVIDDGSTDKTADIVKTYGDKVMLIEQQNAGASAARNAGIEVASGNWIAFLDGDDEWLDEKLRLQTEHLARNPDLQWTTGNFFRCHCEQGHQRLSDLPLTKAESHTDAVFDDYLVSYPRGYKGHTDTMLIRRDLLFEAGLFLPGLKRMNDIDMWFRIAYIRPQIGFVFEPLAVYHLDVPGSIIKIHTDWHMINAFLRRHLELAEKHNRSEAFRSCAQICLRYWIHILIDKNQGRAIRKLIQSQKDVMDPGWYRDMWKASFVPRLWKWRQKRKRKNRGRT